MNRWFQLFFALAILSSCLEQQSQPNIPKPLYSEQSDSNKTPTYDETIQWWKALDKVSMRVRVLEFGLTDAGLPLHVVLLDPVRAKKLKEYGSNRKKQLLLINNAIHPGEPDGVNASMDLAYTLLTDSSIDWNQTVVAIIPFYNVGGALRRNAHSRANQNGPERYGFRGNAQNLDLNRDFIKCDSRNAQSFAELIQQLDPDLYIETHVSNGADYQYTMTYLPAQEDKAGKIMGTEYREVWTPFLQDKMTASGFPMVPYVNVHGVPPDNGYSTFYDSPRYSTGMLSLHHIPGYITETHMLKPFNQRVRATYEFLLASVELLHSHPLRKTKVESRKNEMKLDTLPIDWQFNTNDSTVLSFNGYESGYKPSEVSGLPRLYYDREQPFNRPVTYFGHMEASRWSIVPEFYVLRGGYQKVVDRLKWNGILLETIERDTMMRLRVNYIDKTESLNTPYEGHYLHYNTSIRDTILKIPLFRGDFLVRTKENNTRFLVNTLDPRAPDSYFNWNFFDPILQRKEYFSSYVFEDLAVKLLATDPALNERWEAFKQTDNYQKNYKNSARNQLHWIYTNSQYSEPVYRQYPVFQSVQ